MISRHDLEAEQRVGLPSDRPLKIPYYVINDLDNDLITSKSIREII